MTNVLIHLTVNPEINGKSLSTRSALYIRYRLVFGYIDWCRLVALVAAG